MANRAQCETGGCSGQYDCSSANISPVAGTTMVEWTFYQQFRQHSARLLYRFSRYQRQSTAQISPSTSRLRAVDDLDPVNAKDWHWLNWNYPLTVHAEDLREPNQCVAANGSGYKINRAQIDTTSGGAPGYPFLGYVIVDGSGNPTMPAGNRQLFCLSNCGKYKFPTELGKDGCDLTNDPNCYSWTTFCAGNTPSSTVINV